MALRISGSPAATGKLLYVSRSAPPGVSGSAHVLKALMAEDHERRLVAVGARSFWSAAQFLDGRLHLFPTELNLFGRGARFLAPLRQLLRRRLASRISEVAKHSAIEGIVAVFPDALYCEAALDAAKRVGKPVDVYFHNTYADNRRGIPGWHARRLEQRMVAQSRRLLFISDALMARFIAKYPAIAGKCEVLRHPVPAVGTNPAPRAFAARPVRATMMGNLNESNFDAASRMLRALAGRDDLRVSLCTPVPRLLLKARGMSLDDVDYLGYLPEEQMPALLADTDLFLLPHGLKGGYSEQEYRTIFPTRAAHYLAQARPLLAHCPDDSGLAQFLQRHDCAVCVGSADEDAVRAAFEQLLADPARQQQLAGNAAIAARLFAPGVVLEQLFNVETSA